MKKRHVLGTVQVSRKCNQDCVFCSAPNSDAELSFEEAKKTIDDLKKEDVTEVMFTGGEPTLRDDLPELIRYAKAQGFEEVSVQTNASRLHDEKLLKAYIKSGLDKFDISYHTNKKDIFPKLSRGDGDFDQFCRGVKNVEKYRIHAYFTTVINALNYRDLQDMVIFSEKNFPHIRHFSYNFVDPTNNAMKNKWIVPRLTDAKPHMLEAFQYILDRGMGFRIEFVPLCFLPGFEEYCSEVRREAFDEPSFTGLLEEGSINRRANYYSKPDVCSECELEPRCPGLNQNYINIHGDKELVPRLKKQDHIILQIDNRCNQKCAFCSVTCDNTTMPFSELKKSLITQS